MFFENKILINGIETNFIVFDKPFKEYYQLALIAATSLDRLANNYRRPPHQGKEFMTLVTANGQPVFMFGTEKDPGLPSNIARGFVRTFMDPNIRAVDLGTGIGSYTEFFKYFYNLYPLYHERLGIDTIFITRNYRISTRQERGLERYFKPMNFIKYPEPLVYNGVPQWFFVNGDSTFCQFLPKYIESSE